MGVVSIYGRPVPGTDLCNLVGLTALLKFKRVEVSPGKETCYYSTFEKIYLFFELVTIGRRILRGTYSGFSDAGTGAGRGGTPGDGLCQGTNRWGRVVRAIKPRKDAHGRTKIWWGDVRLGHSFLTRQWRFRRQHLCPAQVHDRKEKDEVTILLQLLMPLWDSNWLIFN